MTKVQQMDAGQRVIMSTEELDALLGSDDANRIASAHNRNRLGLRDEYVCWTQESARPPDLSWDHNMQAWATK